MFKNYLTVAIRVLRNNKPFAWLNILGLALGITCSLLILLWVKDERAVDAFHLNKDRLYVLYERNYADGQVNGGYSAPGLLSQELKRSIPEVQYAVSIDWGYHYTFRTGNKALKEQGGFAGADFFRLFSYPLVGGNAASALNGRDKMAISRGMAIRFFGSPEAAMGKTLRRDSANAWKDFVVSGVFDEPAGHSSLEFDYLISWDAYLDENPWMRRWDNSGPYTMMALRADARPDRVREKIQHLLARFEEHPIPGHRTELGMQRFDEQYLHSRFENGEPASGRIAYVRLFSLVAVFILLIACINFMNLTTARSVKRAKEIGVRKVIGAGRRALVGQFLGEAVLLALAAAGVAILLVIVVLPYFSSMTGKHLLLPFSEPSFWGQLLGLALLTGIISGSYPAIFLSSFQPVKVLKGVMATGGGAVLFRKGLVVFQFVLSMILIVGTLVVTRQVNYLQTINLGYNRENLLYIPLEGRLSHQYPLFRERAVQLPGVKAVTYMTNAPTSLENGTSNVEWEGKNANDMSGVTYAAVGYDYIRTMGIRLLAGRDFSKSYPTDSVGCILNEAAVEMIGFKDPIGRSLTMWGQKCHIIGVIRNFHFASLHEAIKPLVLLFKEENDFGNILVRVAPGQTREALAGLGGLCKQLNPGFPFTYQFSDDEYQKLYTSEMVVGQLSRSFAVLAILISCMGLLGLALFTAEQRTKEIGIRKVLGAGVGQLFGLLSRDFLMLVLLAFVIATPVAWWGMGSWLRDYAYHVDLEPGVFVLAGLLAFGIALLTVGYHSIRAARANPVKSLRSE